MKGSKILATIVAIAMVMSTMAMLNVSDNIVKADRNTDYQNTGGYNTVVLSNDGTGGQQELLTCGELITLYVNNNSLTPDEDYGVQVWDGDSWETCIDVSSTDDADEYGDLAIQFRVPGWSELSANPISDNGDTGLTAGQWNISLFTEDSGGSEVFGAGNVNITLNIGNLYDVYYTLQANESSDDAVDSIIWGEEQTVYVHVRNWTGTEWEEDYSETNGVGDWRLTVTDPNGDYAAAAYNNYLVQKSYKGITLDAWMSNYEYNYWVNVSSDDNSALYSNVSLPVKLDLTLTSSVSNLEWGDSFDLKGGLYYNDTSTDDLEGYELAVFAPNSTGNGDWERYNSQNYLVENGGSYTISVVTGPDEGYNAGTWYLGTNQATNLDASSQPPYQTNFIPYYSFTVGTNDDDLNVDVENTDDIITGFEQTVNVSVKNDSFMYSGSSDGTKEWQNMNIHVTGLAGYDQDTGIEYDDDDIVPVTLYRQYNESDEDYSYYLFNYTFNETGTATIIATWEENYTSHTIDSPDKLPGNDSDKLPGNDSFYSNTYNERTELLPNIKGTTTFTVVAADSMNLIIDEMVDSVSVSKSGNYWKNSTGQEFLLEVFGSTASDPMNATITISGCGLSFTIDEEDPGDADECVGYPGYGGYTAGQYYISIAPKTAGTLTITVTNGTNEVTKDYTVTGLTGSVTTSEGDDLEIEVGSTETITLETTTSYAPVHVSYYDSSWNQLSVLNYTDDPDGSAGEGLDGTYTFTPDADDITKTGYIVVAAEASAGNGLFMYDIIEVVPIYDLEVQLISPINDTQMFTAGLEYDLVVKLVDEDGNNVEDDTPSITVKLTDEDHDEDNALQTWTISSSSGDGEWELSNMICWHDGTLVISGENASTGITHKGNLSVDVGHATITYSPTAATAGIGKEDLTVTVTGVDANGDPLPEDTDLYFWCEEAQDSDVTSTTNADGVNFKDADTSIKLDENGEGEFELDEVGDEKTSINATFVQFGDPDDGNKTLGKFDINFPTFELSRSTIYIGQANDITITAKDASGDAIKGLNLTLWGSTLNGTGNQPDPVKTDSDGIAIFSINPESSGVINVTIARNLQYVGGELTWTNAIITDTSIKITSIKTFQISVSKSPITEGETLTVTVTDGTNPVSSANVEFAGTTQSTDSSGQATFTAPDPMVESVTYYVEVTKEGYTTKDKGVTVVKKYEMSIAGPSGDVETGKSFTVTVISKGSSLAGATVTFEGTTVTSDGDGKATFTAPDTKGTYEVTASHEDYTADATLDITVKKAEGGTPGFELLTLIAAIGVAFILLRRRRNK